MTVVEARRDADAPGFCPGVCADKIRPPFGAIPFFGSTARGPRGSRDLSIVRDTRGLEALAPRADFARGEAEKVFEQ
jgi:hypothetical protein